MVRRLMSVVAVVIGIGTMTPPSHLGLAQGGGQPAWVPGRPGDWLLHNLDQHNRRFSPLDEINRTNPEQLTVSGPSSFRRTSVSAQRHPSFEMG